MGGQLGQKVYFYIFEHFKRKSFWWPTKRWIMHNPVFNISASRSVSFHIHWNICCTIKNNNMESHIQIMNDTSMENWYLNSWHMTKRFVDCQSLNKSFGLKQKINKKGCSIAFEISCTFISHFVDLRSVKNLQFEWLYITRNFFFY